MYHQSLRYSACFDTWWAGKYWYQSQVLLIVIRKNHPLVLDKNEDVTMVFGENKKVLINGYIDARFQTNKGIMVLNLVLCKWWNGELEMFYARTVAYSTTVAKYTTAFEVTLEITWIRKLVSELYVVCNVLSLIYLYCR